MPKNESLNDARFRRASGRHMSSSDIEFFLHACNESKHPLLLWHQLLSASEELLCCRSACNDAALCTTIDKTVLEFTRLQWEACMLVELYVLDCIRRQAPLDFMDKQFYRQALMCVSR